MNRRGFLRATALVATTGAVPALARGRSGSSTAPAAPVSSSGGNSAPAVTRLTVPAAGMYRIAGRVRVAGPRVDISGLTYGQSASWSGQGEPLTSFTAFEYFDTALAARTIEVHGGQIASLTAELIDAA